MRLSTRLLWPLLTVVGVIMLAYGAYTVRRRERQLLADVHREAHAFGTALAIALEYAISDGDPENLTRILGRLASEPRIYGAIVYDAEGRPIRAAEPLTLDDGLQASQVRVLLADTGSARFDRSIGGESFYSVFRLLRRGDQQIVGGVEVVHPLAR